MPKLGGSLLSTYIPGSGQKIMSLMDSKCESPSELNLNSDLFNKKYDKQIVEDKPFSPPLSLYVPLMGRRQNGMITALKLSKEIQDKNMTVILSY